ncbi:HTH_Tnp_Tc3_2 domain-containing protein [Trichonephila clavipes]|nr:HTH_Tnp_Tc3_2 domain-containing protein [Trichonephila clavipes]
MKKLVIVALYRSPLTVTLWPSSFLKKYGPMIPPAHKAHQTASRRAVLLARWIVRSVPLEIVGSSGHEKVPMRGKPGLERPGRPRGEKSKGHAASTCGPHSDSFNDTSRLDHKGRVYRRGGSGRPRNTNDREDRAIRRVATSAPTTSLASIQRHLPPSRHPVPSRETIRRRLTEVGLRSRRPLRRLPLTPHHRQCRLDFYRPRATWV